MVNKNIHVLIYGAGVIGSIYAVELSKAGYDVTVYARSNRLLTLKSQGLLYSDRGIVKEARITITEKVSPTDIYDYIFVIVRYEQVEFALIELADNESKTIITMANNPDGYANWEKIAGSGKILPAFPGAGGKIENGVLYYQITPRVVQTTTFGEINGKESERVNGLSEIFKASKMPYSITKNMDAWQKSHIAMIIALANGFYFDGGDNYTTSKNKNALRLTSSAAKENFKALKRIGVPITPTKLNIFRICPLWLLDFALSLIFNTKFAETVMASHAIAAKDEMRLLEEKFNELVNASS